MDSTKASKKRNSTKPEKPRPDFPLFAHATKRWAKKVRGKTHYFGPWDDPKSALDKWLEQKDFLLSGRAVPAAPGSRLTLKSLVNTFLTSKRRAVVAEELSQRSLRDYFNNCELLIQHLGSDCIVEELRPTDFETLRSELKKGRGHVALGNEIGRARVLFNYAYDSELLAQPVRYGKAFQKPSRKVLRTHRKQQRRVHGKRMFEASEIRTILNATEGKEITLDVVDEETGDAKKVTPKANPAMKAMILLGINCAFGQSDVANIPISAFDLAGGWVEYSRGKTGISRRCKLWPETVKAVRQAISVRPQSKTDADDECAFLTRRGVRWVRMTESESEDKVGSAIDPLSREFRKLLDSLNINGKRGFYCFRRGFRTVAGRLTTDEEAIDCVMGHTAEPDDMGEVYDQDEFPPDEQLESIAKLVRDWLFSGTKNS